VGKVVSLGYKSLVACRSPAIRLSSERESDKSRLLLSTLAFCKASASIAKFNASERGGDMRMID
jgi:hypothetical protein